MTKEEITRPEPGSLPVRISFIEQAGGSAGYYVRFKDVPEESASGGEVERKYIPILQHETQEEALQAAIEYRDQRAEELGLPIEAHQGPHTEETREQMSGYHNRLGLRGLGLSLDNSAGTIYPQLTAMWTGEEGQEKVKRGMTSRGIWETVELLVPHLRKHIHTETSEETLARRGAESVAERLVSIAHGSGREESAQKESAQKDSNQRGSGQTDKVQRRVESLLRQWALESKRDREIIERER